MLYAVVTASPHANLSPGQRGVVIEPMIDGETSGMVVRFQNVRNTTFPSAKRGVTVWMEEGTYRIEHVADPAFAAVSAMPPL